MSIVSESTLDQIDGIPVVIVYNENETYATQGGVNYDKLTYELLLDEEKANKFTVTKTKPMGPVDRLLTDVLGLAIIYAGTFILCDLFRTFKKGRWTSLAWMFLGPWNALTGAPLLHRISHLFDKVDDRSFAINRCQSKYETGMRECNATHAQPIIMKIFGDDGNSPYDDCASAVTAKYEACIKATPDYYECTQDLGDGTYTYCIDYYDDHGNPTQTCEDLPVSLSPGDIQDICLDQFTVYN